MAQNVDNLGMWFSYALNCVSPAPQNSGVEPLAPNLAIGPLEGCMRVC